MDLLARLKEDIIVADGGFGAIVLSRGLAPEECEESWNLTHPKDIEEIHRDFIEAGAELVTTNTFKANRRLLAKHGLGDKVEEVNRAAVEAARRAAAPKGAFVVGCIGPIGELLEPYGDLTAEAARELFREPAMALARAGADALFLETFMAIEEAEIAVKAAKETGLPVVASMAFQASGATMMGVGPEQAAARLSAAGAEVVGANCGVGPVELFPIMEKMKASYAGLTIAQPNAGMPRLIEGKTVFPEKPETMGEYAKKFRNLGINIIGGCCGNRPEHIRAIAKALRGGTP